MARRRARRAHPWLWTTLTAVLGVVWVGSYWRRVDAWYSPSTNGYRMCTLCVGVLRLQIAECDPPRPWVTAGWHARTNAVQPGSRIRQWLPGWGWLPGWESGFDWGVRHWAAYLPVWPFAVLSSLVAAVHWRRAKRLRPGLCLSCGYNREGLAADAVCPECGAGGAAPPLREGSA
jgi:hypothetical protein